MLKSKQPWVLLILYWEKVLLQYKIRPKQLMQSLAEALETFCPTALFYFMLALCQGSPVCTACQGCPALDILLTLHSVLNSFHFDNFWAMFTAASFKTVSLNLANLTNVSFLPSLMAIQAWTMTAFSLKWFHSEFFLGILQQFPLTRPNFHFLK